MEVSSQVLIKMTERIANNKSAMLWGEIALSETLRDALKDKKKEK